MFARGDADRIGNLREYSAVLFLDQRKSGIGSRFEPGGFKWSRDQHTSHRKNPGARYMYRNLKGVSD